MRVYYKEWENLKTSRHTNIKIIYFWLLFVLFYMYIYLIYIKKIEKDLISIFYV